MQSAVIARQEAYCSSHFRGNANWPMIVKMGKEALPMVTLLYTAQRVRRPAQRILGQGDLMGLVDSRLRPNVVIDSKSIESYYNQELLPQLRQSGAEQVPLAEVTPKIKELLTEHHIAPAERELWPVALDGEQIVWMRGFPVPAKLRAQPEREAVLIRETPWAEEYAI